MSDRISGDCYVVTQEEKQHFVDNGYVHLRGLLRGEEVSALEQVYDRFLHRQIPVPGKDYCDMAGDYGRAPEDFSIVNVMLPRRYYPEWRNNIFERRAASVAQQLCGDGMVLDYDQLLAKMPSKDDAVFEYHQDLAYWPDTADTRTTTIWLAIDNSTLENGCMRFVPATSKEPKLRPHTPQFGDRGKSHALAAQLRSDDEVVPVPIQRGDVTVHNERVMHGSGGNHTNGYRRAYVVAFRAEGTVRIERELGFTHSHNDDRNVLHDVGVVGESRTGR